MEAVVRNYSEKAKSSDLPGGGAKLKLQAEAEASRRNTTGWRVRE